MLLEITANGLQIVAEKIAEAEVLLIFEVFAPFEMAAVQDRGQFHGGGDWRRNLYHKPHQTRARDSVKARRLGGSKFCNAGLASLKIGDYAAS
jgi:hypothetical protein